MHPSTSSAPQAEEESILGHFLLDWGDLEVGVVHLVVFTSYFGGRRLKNKKVVNFFEEKCTPDKILARPMSVTPV